jgi:xylan 1,4-beta-xylosidase
MLHHLGNERLANDSKNALVTRRSDGTLVVAVWNMADPPAAHQPGGPGVAKQMQISFEHVPGDAAVSITRLDPTHGNTLAAYRRMGSPRYPSEAQVRALNEASKLSPPEKATLRGGKIDVNLPVNSLVMLEVGP